jgi:hypothetical protein
MNKPWILPLLAGLLAICSAANAHADSTYTDPALTDQSTFCWDSTFNAWVDCSPIVWSTNPDPNSGGGPKPCPTTKDLGTCLQGCDCEYEHNTSTCGSNKSCLDAAISQQKQCYERCAVDWP